MPRDITELVKPDVIEITVSMVDAPEAVYHKANTIMVGRSVVIRDQARRLLATFEFLEDPTPPNPEPGSDPVWTGMIESGPLVIRQLKTCACGGTRVENKT